MGGLFVGSRQAFGKAGNHQSEFDLISVFEIELALSCMGMVVMMKASTREKMALLL